MVAVARSPQTVLQFFGNNGLLLVGGSLLTQVGGVNATTYQDKAGLIPLPNPIPLNSRGEISNASGISCELWLASGSTYTFTLFDAAGNQIGVYPNIAGLIDAVGAVDLNGNNAFTGANSFAGTSTFNGAAVFNANVSVIDNQFRIIGSTTPSKQLAFEVDTNVPASTTLQVVTGAGTILPPGLVFPYAGASVPLGWLPCDGAAVSRTVLYAALFAAIGTTWGVGDGSLTFNVPNFNGRTLIGDGTGTVTESVTTSSANGFTVASNSTKWLTGMAITFPTLTGFTTSATSGPTYYVVRISSTNIRFATTLALALAASPDVTISGAGTATILGTFTARTLGQGGGEETHAQAGGEVGQHSHIVPSRINNSVGAANNLLNSNAAANDTSATTSLNAAPSPMNIMQPFGVVKYIISY